MPSSRKTCLLLTAASMLLCGHAQAGGQDKNLPRQEAAAVSQSEALEQAGAGCNGPLSCQEPDQASHGGFNAVHSDAHFGSSAADSFTLAATEQIDRVRWWGIFLDAIAVSPCGTIVDESYTLTIHLDAGGQLGAIVSTNALGSSPKRIQTGMQVSWIGQDFDEYEFTVDLVQPFVAGASETYWVVIEQLSVVGSCTFFWQTAPQGTFGDGSALWDQGQGDGYLLESFDLALCINPIDECNGPLSCQEPDQDPHGGVPLVQSDALFTSSAADSFTWAASEQINRVRWWGSYMAALGFSPCETILDDDFTLTIHADAGGQLGAIVSTNPLGSSGTRLLTGNQISFFGNLNDEYQYTADLIQPFFACAGETYWMVVQRGVVDDCAWWWETAPQGTFGDGSALSDPDGDGYVLESFDLAFCINPIDDCNDNGVCDSQDIESGTSPDCNANDVPDECEGTGPVVLDWWGSQSQQSCIYSSLGQDARLGNCANGYIEGIVELPTPDRWALDFAVLPDEWTGSDLSDYVDVFIDGELVGRFLNSPRAVEAPVHVEIVGSSFEYRFEFVSSNSLDHAHLKVLPGEARGLADCNDNGVLDECDIADGFSGDCNVNGTPDECEFAGTVDCNGNGTVDLCDPGGAEDCNQNGLPDLCDLNDGTSDDCNANGVPDECETHGGGSTLDFDGSDDWVRVPRTPLLEPTEELTIETWIRSDSIGSTNNSRIVRIASASGAGYMLSWRQSGSSKLELRIDSASGGACRATDPTPVSTYFGHWIHVAAVYSSSKDLCQLYVNGVLKADEPSVGTLLYSGSDLFFGNHVESGEDFDGLIDEVRLWNVARTQAEIVAHKDFQLLGSEPGLVGYWRFNEASGQVVLDSSPHGHDGVLGENDGAGGDFRDPLWVSPGAPIAEGDCNTNDVLDECDIADGTSADCNENGRPDECEPDEDCNSNGTQDICDIFDGTSFDCNGSGIPDACELIDNDCNGNEIPDECDLTEATSFDCNTNGVPDECDIDGGLSNDCDGDVVPDECEPDGDGDQIPDDCDEKGDFDHDGNRDLDDYWLFQICFELSGPGEPPPFFECLDVFDFNDDGVVDLWDYAQLSLVFGE